MQLPGIATAGSLVVLQVAFKRFCDNLPREVDTTLLRALVQVLPEQVFKGPLADLGDLLFWWNDPGGILRCSWSVQIDPDIFQYMNL